MEFELLQDYVVIKALESGVSVAGLTRGDETKFLHSEKLERGEVLVAQFTEHVAMMKIRGQARVWTKYGTVDAESEVEPRHIPHRVVEEQV